MSNQKSSLVVLISGNGSNLQAIIDAIHSENLNVVIKAVISNNPDAKGLQRATLAGINTITIPNREPELSVQLLTHLTTLQPDLIVLAGFMRILPRQITEKFPQRIINIHPSLLPKYPGLHTHQRVLSAGETEHGCTVHYVDHTLDGGPIITQRSLQIAADDTAESLQKKVQALEHQLYPFVIKQLCGN